MKALLSVQDVRDVLADLPLLVAVARHEGVTAAAEELGIPQPTVSRGIARLALRVGAPMLTRSGRGVELSPEARAILPFAERAISALSDGMDAMRRDRNERDETVSIAFQNTLGRSVVPALLRALLGERPSSRFRLRQGARVLCVESLESGEADVALVSPPLEAGDGIRTVRLYAEPLVLAVPTAHPFAGRDAVALAALGEERMLMLGPAYGLRTIVDELLVRAGISPQIAFEGEDIHTLRGLVSAGLGVAILPPAAATTPDVAEVPISDAHAEREIGISWSTTRARSAAATALCELAESSDAWLPERNRASAAIRRPAGRVSPRRA